MSYKTVLFVVSRPQDLHAPLEAAIAFARQQGAHLDVLCIGVDLSVSGYYAYGGAIAVSTASFSEEARQEAQALCQAAEERLSRVEFPYALKQSVVLDTGIAPLIGRWARYCDLALLPQPEEDSDPAEAEAIIEAALFGGEAPVLVMPRGQETPPKAERIVLAWNESDEAFAAMRAALPLLTSADEVSVAIVNPSPRGRDETPPGEDIARLLSRHGVKVEVTLLPQDLPHVSQVLARHASDIGADLIVMGAYGHSRLREAILGGATRDLILSTQAALFLAH